MRASVAQASWLRAYSAELAGIPRPGREWMLRDVPSMDLSLLRSALQKNLISRIRKERRGGTRTGRATTQSVYRTTELIYEWFDEHEDLPREVFETVAVDPAADAIVIDVTAAPNRTIECCDVVRSRIGVTVQVICVPVQSLCEKLQAEVETVQRALWGSDVIVYDGETAEVHVDAIHEVPRSEVGVTELQSMIAEAALVAPTGDNTVADSGQLIVSRYGEGDEVMDVDARQLSLAEI